MIPVTFTCCFSYVVELQPSNLQVLHGFSWLLTSKLCETKGSVENNWLFLLFWLPANLPSFKVGCVLIQFVTHQQCSPP